MRLIVVPHRVESFLTKPAEAALWIGALETAGRPAKTSLTLRWNSGQAVRTLELTSDGWQPVTANDALLEAQSPIWIRTLRFSDLDANTNYTLHGADDGLLARFKTPPTALPVDPERPFTVLLSSCFHRSRDKDGLLGSAFLRLPEKYRPDLKILCGDQVYLDVPDLLIPVARYSEDKAELARGFLRAYLETWGQIGLDGNGYQRILAHGATYFTADDHEFWNNFPYSTPLVENSHTPKGREAWGSVALALFQSFQCEEGTTAGQARTFNVDLGRPLSFFIADTRVWRGRRNEDFEDFNFECFMSPADFARLQTWLAELTGPGVLVLGQPLLDAPGGALDYNLANYAQYPELVRALDRLQHSLIVLSGDIHYGRVAVCKRPSSAAYPVKLWEIISSPGALVHPSVPGSFRNAPDRFPPIPLAGAPPAWSVQTRYKTKEANHFTTIQFSRPATRLRMEVRYWFAGAATGTSFYSEAIVDDEL